MEKQNRYRKRIRLITIMRLLFVGALLGSIGVSFVTVRNKHVLKGEEIRKVEVDITELSREIEMWELRIAGVKDRSELQRRLRWAGSSLKDIEVDRVLEITPRADDGVVGLF